VWEEGWPFPVAWERYSSDRAEGLVRDLLYINIYWGLVNLLPIYPLDGGQIARAGLDHVRPDDGVRLSLWFSIFAATAMAIVALVRLEDTFLTFFFGYFAYMSYTEMQERFGTRGGWGGYR
jgi:Zn-dependent protease